MGEELHGWDLFAWLFVICFFLLWAEDEGEMEGGSNICGDNNGL